MLSKNIRPLPNLKEKNGVAFNSFEDKELRYRHRQLDLIVNPNKQKRDDVLDIDINMNKNIEEKYRSRLERAALTCPVHKSLHPDLVKKIRFFYS